MKQSIAILLVLALLATACQTAKPATKTATSPTKTEATAPASTAPAAQVNGTPAPSTTQVDPSSIKAGDTGFSPLAQAPHNYMTFTLHFGYPDQVKTWSVDFASDNGRVVRSIKGTAPQLPGAVTWDGNADDGTPSAEGRYIAKLSVDHGDKGGVETTQTDPLLLDRTPASGAIVVTPQPYVLGDPSSIMEGPKVTMTLNVTPGIAAVSSWRLFVIHPNGSQFMDFISEDHKDNIIVWNGRAQNNATMEAGTEYNLTAQIFDVYGNVGTLKTTIKVVAGPSTTHTEVEAKDTAKPQAQESPVTVTLDGQTIAEAKIYFPAYSADMTKVDAKKMAINNKSLDSLATALKAANGTKVKVTGHANKVFWQDQAKGDAEQRSVLIPLSKARATAVQNALVARGLSADLFDLDGVGAIGAVAPFGDLANNWKNRRVEFNVEN